MAEAASGATAVRANRPVRMIAVFLSFIKNRPPEWYNLYY
ncbi:hypothetical protein C1A50_2878 [Paenibacillus polymyxa]|nr:hypothetical protein C1A50_2878 [Paenibacillus polymyxa]